MSKFIEVKATRKTPASRSLIQNVGIYDAEYKAHVIINGKRYTCPYYKVWGSMINRCYSDLFKLKNPSYIGCVVTKEWLTFSNFKKWMVSQDWENKDLDKDIINPGNKIYSSENCVFVHQSINKLFTGKRKDKGVYPQGVCLNHGRYRSRCNVEGKPVFIGNYKTINEAETAYNKFKRDLIINMAKKQVDHRVHDGLLRHAELISQKIDSETLKE